MSQNNEITIPFSEYVHLISHALFLEELVKLGLKDWEFYDQAMLNVDSFLNEEDDEISREV